MAKKNSGFPTAGQFEALIIHKRYGSKESACNDIIPPVEVESKKSFKPNLAGENNHQKELNNSVAGSSAQVKVGTRMKGVEENGRPPLQRRHSTGSTAAQVNHANLTAAIRRSQRRLHRRPRMSKLTVALLKCMSYYTAFAYYSCMSSIKPPSAEQLPQWVQKLQLGVYRLFAFISTVNVSMDVKDGWMDFRANDDMKYFLFLGFHVTNLLTRTFNIYLNGTSSESASKLLKNIDKVASREIEETSDGCHRLIPYGICALSLLIAGVSTTFGNVPFDEWSFKNALLDRSYELGDFLLRWTTSNYTTVTYQLLKDYGTKLTLTTEVFAVVGNVFCFIGTLHGCLIVDLWPILSLQIYFLQARLSMSLRETKETDPSGKCPLSIHWQQYMEVRDLCDEVDAVFGNQIKFIHLQNLLLYVYFLLQLVRKERIHADLLIDTFSVIKVSVIYYLLLKSASENEAYEDCVTKCSNHGITIEMDGIKKSVAVLLKDMEKHPIGVGRGGFFVNGAFLMKERLDQCFSFSAIPQIHPVLVKEDLGNNLGVIREVLK